VNPNKGGKMRLTGKQKKTLQYSLGGIVGIIILAAWITSPLMHKSPWDVSVPEGNPFKSKVADLSSFDSAIPYESGAPGAPLSGELTVNPATSGEEMLSSLYSSGLSELAGEEELPGTSEEDLASVSAESSKYSPSAGSPSAGPKAKLSKLPSITAGNSGTQSLGSRHSKFFGSGNERPDFKPSIPTEKIGKINDNNSKLLASVNNAQEKSAKAMGLKGKFEGSRMGAASAFNKLVAAKGDELTTQMEESAAESGILMGNKTADLKKNDPSLNKTKITLPQPQEAEVDNNDEMYKQMLFQMLMQVALGPVFGSLSQVMTANMMQQMGADSQIGKKTSWSLPEKKG